MQHNKKSVKRREEPLVASLARSTAVQATTKPDLVRQNLRLVKQLYPAMPRVGLVALRDLTKGLRLSVSHGDILCIDGKWYVTHAGLLRIALRRRCRGIRTILQERLCDPLAGRWVFKATVYKGSDSKGFVGYGDADPSTCLPWSAEPRCALPRPGPLIAPSAKPMESACARSKSSDPSLRPHQLHIPSKPRLFLATGMVPITASPDCGTNSAF